ncbi:MAG: tyrosine-protein phosphatase [Clostridiales bacterium]|nr:tyrosine-protein phosphatase [Clostridiales bacterium]
MKASHFQEGSAMSSLLQSTANTRPVLPGSLRLIRSDAPTAPTAEDVAFLQTHGVTLLIDLRSEAECLRRPCPLSQHPGFTCLHLPVTGGNAMPASPEDVPRSYLRMVDGQMAQILDIIRSADSGVMYFCTAGKDRTGVVSALLQREHGLSRREIVADYLLSGENLRERLDAFARLHPEIDPAIYTPQPVYMERFLDGLEG